MIGTVSAGRMLRRAILVAALGIAMAGPASAGIDESIAVTKEGDYMAALKHLVIPMRYSLEKSICDALIATMPRVDRGIASVEALVADIYYFGHFVPKDYGTAVQWYLRAGDKGNALAQSTLGDIYYYGRGAPQNFTKAAAWWQLAADQGVAVAQLNLSVLYANGEGVPKDLVKSHLYANLAAAQLPLGKDYEIAVKNREFIANQMAPEEIAEAQRRAEALQSAPQNAEQADGEPDVQSAGDAARCVW